MQWIALDENRPVFAPHASKEKKYLCPECGSFLKVRSGPHRQPHFFHVVCSPKCRQSQKTEEHLRLQLDIVSQLPEGEGCAELAFPEIRRIADVAWPQRKILYEIQCSPISLEEAKQRCEDYRRAGWQLIWILSDKRFNNKYVSSAEAYLRTQPCYFSHWEKRGRKYIYDQCEVFSGFQRIYKGMPFHINPLHVKEQAPQCPLPFSLPRCLQERLENWPLFVEKDILSQLQGDEPHWINKVKEIEKQLETRRLAKRLSWLTLIRKCYEQLLNKIFTSLG